MRRSDDQHQPSVSELGPVLSSLLSVATIADLAPLTYGDGTGIYVRSVRDYWVYRAASTTTADAITVVAHSSGTGRWERLNMAHPSWARQTDWAISEASGADEASGTAASPLRTSAEFNRRTKGLPLVGFITLAILDDMSAANSLVLDLTFVDDLVSGDNFFLKGKSTQVATGQVDTFTALNRATPSKNTIARAGLNFTSHVGRFLRMTSGTANGYSAPIFTGSNGSCTLGSFTSTIADPNGSTAAATVAVNSIAIAANDTFEIVEKVSIGYAVLRSRVVSTSGASSTGSLTCVAVAKDVRVTHQGSGGLGNVVRSEMISDNGARWVMHSCDLGGMKIGVGSHVIMNCRFYAGTTFAASAKGGYGPDIQGGGMVGGSICGITADCAFDGDFIFQAVQLDVGAATTSRHHISAGCRLGTVGFFDQTVDAIVVRGNGFIENRVGAFGVSQVWGLTAASLGIRIRPRGAFTYVTKPTLNAGLGLTREISVGATDMLLAGLPFVELVSLAAMVVET